MWWAEGQTKNDQNKKNCQKTINRLRERLNKVIGSEGVELSEDDEEIEELISQTENDVTRNYSRDYFQRISWEQQRDYNKLKKQEKDEVAPSHDSFCTQFKTLVIHSISFSEQFHSTTFSVNLAGLHSCLKSWCWCEWRGSKAIERRHELWSVFLITEGYVTNGWEED